MPLRIRATHLEIADHQDRRPDNNHRCIWTQSDPACRRSTKSRLNNLDQSGTTHFSMPTKPENVVKSPSKSIPERKTRCALAKRSGSFGEDSRRTKLHPPVTRTGRLAVEQAILLRALIADNQKQQSLRPSISHLTIRHANETPRRSHQDDC